VIAVDPRLEGSTGLAEVVVMGLADRGADCEVGSGDSKHDLVGAQQLTPGGESGGATVMDVRAAVDEMRDCGVEFEQYDTQRRRPRAALRT
jgi:hypothetical protein